MSECVLLPTQRAFSTFMTAFIGSIVNGISNGALIAFLTGWISWLAWLRIITAAMYEYYLSFKAGTDTDADVTNGKTDGFLTVYEDEANVLGWFGWVWSALYTPASQTIWLVENWTSPAAASSRVSTVSTMPAFGTDLDAGIKLARAIAIGVSALGLTYDNKMRYAASVGEAWGSWAFVVFNFWNATMCLLLGTECVALLIKGVTELQGINKLPWWAILIYCLFSCVWAAASFKILPVADGTRKKTNSLMNTLAGALVGALAGVFVAAPALVLWQNTKFDADANFMLGYGSEQGLSLGAYLSCQEASIAQKFAAIMP